MNFPFSLAQYNLGEGAVTRGGATAHVLAYNKDDRLIYGVVDGKDIVWNMDGTCVIRENYGYDLFMTGWIVPNKTYPLGDWY